MLRELEKKRAFEDRYCKEIEERQDRIDDRTVELYTTCIALAVYDLYGYMPKRVRRIVNAFCERLMSLSEPGVDYFTLREELDRKMGIQFVWDRSRGSKGT